MGNITPAENFRRLWKGTPQWLPFTFDIGAIQGFTDPLLARFQAETGAVDPADHFGYDFRCLSLGCRFGGADPRLFHGEVKPETTFDEWGVGHWAGGAQATYERMYAPLAAARSVRDVEALPLPIAGLMSDRSAEFVREKLRRLIAAARAMGSRLEDPYMAMSFLTLPPIPELKITDRGLIDAVEFKVVPLFV